MARSRPQLLRLITQNKRQQEAMKKKIREAERLHQISQVRGYERQLTALVDAGRRLKEELDAL